MPPAWRTATIKFTRRLLAASVVAGSVEFRVERFRALDDREFDGAAVLEMTHDLAAHGAERDLHAECRLDVDLDGGAGERQVDDTALILSAIGKLQDAHRIARRDALVAAILRQVELVLVGEPGQLRGKLVLLAVGSND